MSKHKSVELTRPHVPKAYIVLRYMIDGETSRWPGRSETYGGKGTALVNFQGGFGYDTDLRRMVREGLATYHRRVHHETAPVFGGNPTINCSYLKVTDKGRKKYELMKKRYGPLGPNL
jgi:hypothetical protein